MKYKIKIKVEAKYNIDDDIVYDKKENNTYYKGKIVGIKLIYNTNKYREDSVKVIYEYKQYYKDGSLTQLTYEAPEDSIMTLAEFNKKMVNNHTSYDDYLNWLSNRDWWEKHA